jgi:galactose oxidase
MSYARAFGNAVVLPDGKVFVAGGQSYPVPFSDDKAILTPELFDPTTQKFTSMASNAIPRVYHSTAILLLDGTVFSGGGGLCDTCTTNHFDAQIWLPPYLFSSDGTRATRPKISSVSSTVATGGTLTVVTGGAVKSFALVRYGSSTHTVNTDQRRIPVAAVAGTGVNTYSVKVPADKGVALPGYWMLFAIDAAGVPSVAKTVKIT